VNIELPEMDCYPHLVELVENGRIDESVLDELIAPMLRAKFELGLFENPYTDTDSFDNEKKLIKDRSIALKAAQETITLLKNENELLPLNLNKIKTLAVIGPNADRVLIGGYSGKPKYNTTVLEGIKDKVGENIEILYSEGCKITINGSWEEDVVTPPDPEQDKVLIKEAVQIAQKADYVVLAIGGNEQTSREAYTVDHLGDRPSLDLIGRQNDLVRAIKETGKPVIVVLFNGRPKSINYISENVPAILECWYLGQESGNAVADVLFGDVNPSGKLPISIPRSVGHIPCFYNHKPSARRGYLFDDISALYPFGFGLSYTEFKLENLTLQKTNISKESSIFVSVDIKNVGKYYGAEVIQMYIRDRVSSVTRPVKELKGFKKIALQPGEKKTISFEILPKHLAFTDVNMNFTVEPGDFEIMIGNSSRDEDLQKVILEVN
jgi:beta-glucosidase